jgi:hypothetical protein
MDSTLAGVYKGSMRTQLTALVIAALCLSPAPARAGLPDLCDDYHLSPTGAPYADSTGHKLSRFCSWTNELEVSVWADHVCCSIGTTSATCKPTDANGRCLAGAKMWCDYATVSGGFVTCQQPWPDACAEGFCSIAAPSSTPQAYVEPLCCEAPDDCYVVAIPSDCDAAKFLHCHSPYTNENGSVGCADE